MDNLSRIAGWKWGVFLRDPTSRYLSAWGSKCLQAEDWFLPADRNCIPASGFARPSFSLLDDDMRSWDSLSLSLDSLDDDWLHNFEEGVVQNHLNSSQLYLNPHWAPQQRFCGGLRNASGYDFVGHLDSTRSMNSQVRDMLRLVGVEGLNVVDRFFPRSIKVVGHSSSLNRRWFYRNSTILDYVRQLYMEDAGLSEAEELVSKAVRDRDHIRYMLAQFSQAGNRWSGVVCDALRYTIGCGMLTLALGSVLLVGFWRFPPDALDVAPVQKQPNVAAPARLVQLDNAKFLLIVIVIMGHALSGPLGMYDLPEREGVSRLLTPWHTRTFALVSGLLSRGPPSIQASRGLIQRNIIPFVSYSVFLQPVLEPLLAGQGWAAMSMAPTKAWANLLYANDVQWYMLALVFWRLWSWLLWWLFRRHAPLRLLTALTFAAIGGYFDGSMFCMFRVIHTFPVYIVGQSLPCAQLLAGLPCRWGRPASLLISLLILVTICAVQCSAAGRAFMENVPYFGWSTGQPAYNPWETKSIMQPGQSHVVVMTFWVRGLFRNTLELSKGVSFLQLCPQTYWRPFSSTGQHSLYPYLLHLIILRVFLDAPMLACFRPFAGASAAAATAALPRVVSVASWLAAVSIVVLLAVALASWPVRVVFRPLLEPAWAEFRRCPKPL